MGGPSQTPGEHPRNHLREERTNIALPGAGTVPLDTLVSYARAVLEGLAENRDVKSDDDGRAIYRLRSSGFSAECTWQLFEVDFSAIGMATDMPLIVYAYPDATELEWHFGPTPIASTPRTSSPKAAADALDMNVLLDGFHRFVLSESVLFPTSMTPPKESGGIFIDPDDGTCSKCDEGELEVIDADDVSMTVECGGCGACYPVEHDAFGDGGIDDVLRYFARRGFDADEG